MKRNLFLRFFLTMIALLSLHSCRNEYQETANQHQHSKAEQFVSFQKFLEITHIQKDGFYQNLTAKTFALNDFDIDTEKIRQTLRSNTATAFSFFITPTDDTQKAGNTFYNLAYIKQSDNSWNKYVIKYVSTDADFVSHLGSNPELKFQGTNEVLYFENNVSKTSSGLCAFTSEVEVWNCPAGHTKLADCYESGGSSSCCMPCISINSVTTVRECSTGTGSGGPDVPYNPDGGSGGGESDGSVFEPNLPLHDPKANTPCRKTKAMLENPAVQTKLDSLKNHSTGTGELGFKTKKDGTTSGIINGGKHAVDMGIKAGYQGGYHNHTSTGIPMHSAPDIESNLLAFARAQPTGEHKNAYFGMVVKKVCTSCPGGFKTYNYIMRFDGEYSDALISFSQLDLDNFNIDYQNREFDLTNPTGVYGTTYIDTMGKITNEGLEKLFFDTLKAMSLTNKIILQRIEDSGIVNNIILNPDGLHTTAIPCP